MYKMYEIHVASNGLLLRQVLMQLRVETNLDSHIGVVEEARLQGNMHFSIFDLKNAMFQDWRSIFTDFDSAPPHEGQNLES